MRAPAAGVAERCLARSLARPRRCVAAASGGGGRRYWTPEGSTQVRQAPAVGSATCAAAGAAVATTRTQAARARRLRLRCCIWVSVRSTAAAGSGRASRTLRGAAAGPVSGCGSHYPPAAGFRVRAGVSRCQADPGSPRAERRMGEQTQGGPVPGSVHRAIDHMRADLARPIGARATWPERPACRNGPCGRISAGSSGCRRSTGSSRRG